MPSQDQQHLALALQDAALYFTSSKPIKQPGFIVNLIMRKVVDQFASNLIKTHSIRVFEKEESTYEVTVNDHAKATLTIEEKWKREDRS